MTTRTSSNEQFNVLWARLAGVFSLIACAIFAASAGVALGLSETLDSTVSTVLVVVIALWTAAIVPSWNLLRLREWSLLWVLGFWLAVTGACVSTWIWSLVYGTPDLWAQSPVSAMLVLGAASAIAVVMCMLCVRATSSTARRRYGANVAITTAAALTVVVVVNIIAQHPDNYARKDFQALGQYSISDRTRNILRSTPDQITATVMYAQDEGDQERRQRVLDLLAEMREEHPGLKIVNASSDAHRAKVIARLMDEIASHSPEHLALLSEFDKVSDSAVARLREVQDQWKKLTGRSYMDNWGLAAFGERHLKDAIESLEAASSSVRREMSQFPDYSRLVEQVQGSARDAVTRIEALEDGMRKLHGIPDAVASNRHNANEELDAVFDAIGKAASSLGPPASTPEDPTGVLERFMTAVDDSAQQVARAAARLDEIAGPANADIIRSSRPWRLGSIQADGMIVEDPRSTITRVYTGLVSELNGQKTAVESLMKAATKEYQAEVIEQMRGAFIKLLRDTGDLNEAARSAINKLATIDPETRRLLDEARDGYLADVVGPLREIADKHLDPIENEELAESIKADNIVLIEVEGKMGIVGFEDVWPQRARPGAAAIGLEGTEERAFNGDSAIGSKILSMTQPPFATVYIIHARTPVVEQLEQQLMQYQMMGRYVEVPSFMPQAFNELRRRMEQANLNVKEWDLASQDKPADIDSAIMVVLPPPPPMQANPYAPPPENEYDQYVQQVTDAIDSGATAIFLTQFDWYAGMSQNKYAYNNYLQANWGIDVRTDCLVIPVQPSSEAPNRYHFAPTRFRHMPLSTFTNHPIARPLQGQRVLWQMLCPVRQVASPEGVNVAGILGVAPGETRIWAIADVERIARQIDSNVGGHIEANIALGDILAPFDVGVAATRDDSDDQPPSRIVVLTMAGALTDNYLAERVSVISPDSGLITYDPPKVNADVIVNSAYWLAGRQENIAAGPVRIQPMRTIDPLQRKWLWAICVIALPVAMLAGGGLLLYVRRR